jgi:NADPH-dependent 2,4-dienoyl-CoA reductase/sulfur reductase-like enzyme
MLSKGLISGQAPAKYLPLRPNGFYEKLGITVTTGVEITSMDPAAKTMTSAAGDRYRGDMVLLATGGVPRTLPLEGADRDGVFTLRTQDDADRIMEAAKAARKAVILGASFIGMEVAAQFRAQEIDVTVVEPEKEPMILNLGEEVGRWLRETHEEEGVRFKLGTKARQLTGDGSVTGLTLESGESLEADLVLMAVGVEPRVDYLEGSSLVAGPSDGVRVNERLETDAPGVYAAGDIAVYPAAGTDQRVEHWVHAEEQGRHVARAMLGSTDPYTRLPFFWTRQFETGLKYAGYPTEFESIVFDGTPGKGEFLAGYFRDGKLVGVASMGKAERFNDLGDELEAGAEITPEAFAQ